MKSFFNRDAQQVGQWLNANDAGTVVFVWKEGLFPGEEPRTGSLNPLRIYEANQEPRALETGLLLADFQDEMTASSSTLDSALQVGSGHSWGLVGVTSSEVAGARYDQVHSLAGAGMPSNWEPQEDTDYFHWAYTDALTMAQETGIVWDGRVPIRDPAFSPTVYERDGDFALHLPTAASPYGVPVSPPPSMPATSNPIDNHNLIASDREENQFALFDLARAIKRGSP